MAPHCHHKIHIVIGPAFGSPVSEGMERRLLVRFKAYKTAESEENHEERHPQLMNGKSNGKSRFSRLALYN